MPSPWEMDWSRSKAAQPVAADAASQSSSAPAPWDRDWGGEAKQPKVAKTFSEKLGETTIGNIAKSIYSAVTLPGDVYAGRAHVPGSPEAQAIPGAVPFGSAESSGERIGDLAFLVNPTPAASGTGRAVRQAFDVANPKAPTSAELRVAAAKDYQSPAVKELAVEPRSFARMSDEAAIALNREGFDSTTAPNTFALLKRLKDQPEGAIVTGDNILSMRKAFGRAQNTLQGSEKEAARRVTEYLDDHIGNIAKPDVIAGNPAAASKAMADARANWAAARRGELLDRKAWEAELKAASSNSGNNVENALRQNLRSALANEKLMRGFSAEEKAALEGLVRDGGSNALRRFGNILGGGGGLGAAVSGAIGAGVGSFLGGPVGLAVGGALPPITGGIFRALGNKMTAAQVEKISEAVRMRSPLGSSLSKFEEAAKKFQSDRTVQNVATMRMAARNLANNLAVQGVAVTARDLLQANR